MSDMTPPERKMRARIAAHAMHAQGKTNTAPARKAFDARFDDEVDPDRLLDPAERAKRAAHAKSAYFQRLALASAKARRKGTRTGSQPAGKLPEGHSVDLMAEGAPDAAA